MFSDYYWNNGIPKGIKSNSSEILFRIIEDPYRRWFVIEAWKNSLFSHIVYDSTLLDARTLNERAQMGWCRKPWKEGFSLLYNRDDRLVIIEENLYQENDLLGCRLLSPHGIPLFEQTLCFEAKGAPFNGVILRDMMGKPVLEKRYAVGEDLEFGELLSEQKNFAQLR